MKKQQETACNQPQRPMVQDEWLTPECLQDIAAALEECPDSETLTLLRQCWPKHALNAACKLLKPDTHQLIMRWVLEQNAAAVQTSSKQSESVPTPAEVIESSESPQAQVEALTPRWVSVKVLKCDSWVDVEETLDAVSKVISKDRVAVYKRMLVHLSLNDRQHLVCLLAAHIQEFPRDRWAYTWLPPSSRKLLNKAREMVKGKAAEESIDVEDDCSEYLDSDLDSESD